MAPAAHDHVNIVVTDMDRSIAFYGTLLGLGMVMDRELSGEWFERVTGMAEARARCVILAAPDGGCRVELLAFAAPSRQALAEASHPATPGLRHAAIRVADLQACLNILHRQFGQDAQVADVPKDIVKGGKRMCYITDPDGALIELCQYGSERPEFC
ncbi:MAG: VOC family protein [Magnetospirillum sp.]|nr:VOC family protein [Magnetospirillum sp.]